MAIKRKVFNLDKFSDGYGSTSEEELREEKRPNIISSRISAFRDRHAPVIDIDFPCYVIPSSTPGHFHLYLDKEMPWSDYEDLLLVMKKTGLIEEGYYKQCIERGASHVRAPWSKKGDDNFEA